MATGHMRLLLVVLLLLLLCLMAEQVRAGFMVKGINAKTFLLDPHWAYDHHTGIIIASDRHKLFKFDTHTDTMTLILGEKEEFPYATLALCLGADSDTLFVLTAYDFSNQKQEVYKYNLKTEALTRIVGSQFLNKSRDIAFHNNMLYIADLGSHRILQVAESGGPVTEVVHDVNPRSIETDADGNIYFVNYEELSEFRSNTTLQWIRATTPGKNVVLDLSGGRFPLFVDKSRTPASIYYSTETLSIKKLTFENGEPVSQVIDSASIYFNSPWLSWPVWKKMIRSIQDLVVTKDGTMYYLHNFEPQNTAIKFLWKLTPTSDFVLALLWIITIGTVLIVAVGPCLIVGGIMGVVDVFLVLHDHQAKSSYIVLRESTRLVNAPEDDPISMDASTMPRLNKSGVCHSTIYTTVSAIRNVYFLFVSVVFAFASYGFLGVAYYLDWNGQNCMGSGCKLTSILAFILIIAGCVPGLGWCAFFWSPFYFVASFLRRNPYQSDIIVVAITLALNLLAVLIILAIGVLPLLVGILFTAIVIILALPVIPAIVVDIVFLVVLVMELKKCKNARITHST